MIGPIILICFCVLVFWSHNRFVYRKYFKQIENFSTYGRSFPIFGHVPYFFGKSPDDIVRMLLRRVAACQRATKIWTFGKLVIVVNTPQDVQTVLNSPHCLEKALPYKALKNSIGIIAAHPYIWKPQRRMLNAPFSWQNSLKFTPVFNEISRRLVNDLEPFCGKGEISLLDKIGYRITEMTLENLLDYKFDRLSLEKTYHMVDETMDIMGEQMLKFYTSILYAHVEKWLEIVRKDIYIINAMIYNFDDAFIDGKQKYMYNIEQESVEIISEEQFRNMPDGFLKRLYRMAYMGRINVSEVEEILSTFVLAGTDTSTRLIGNIILCLAMHPDIQEKLYEHVTDVLGDTIDIGYDTVVQINYLDMVIKETLRFLTVVPVIGRRAAADIQLEHGIIPAGTDIIIPIENVHKSESIWGPNANKFDPDNFLPENCVKRHNCSYIPFSYGPRNCIGVKYAQISLRITVANLVRSFKFATHLKPENLSFGFGMTAKLRNDYSISMMKRGC